MSQIGRAGEPAPTPCYGIGVSRQIDRVDHHQPLEAGVLRDATASEYREQSILLDVTYADPQAGVHMRAGSADRNGSAASTSEVRKHNHYARLGQVSFGERSYKLATLTVESFGCLGKEGSNLVDQVAASIIGGTDASSLARNGVCKECLFQILYSL